MQNDVQTMQTELDESTEQQINIENLIVSGAISAHTRQSLLNQVKQMQTNNTALQISIGETELEVARLQAEYDALDAAHPYQAQ
jgi:predicted transcriptional regulator